MSNIKIRQFRLEILYNPVATTIVQGQSIDPQQLVANTNDADETVPAAKIVNPEVLNEIGQQK